MTPADEIATRLASVRSNIADACARSGRSTDSVRLVLASKTQNADAIAAAYTAGARDFGENYVQEAIAKAAATARLTGIRWHLIGHLQTNKVRPAIQTFTLIHTLDSTRLAAAIALTRPSPPADVLIEVNLGGEASKAGVWPDDAEPLINAVHTQVNVRGLMTIPPPAATAADTRRWFSDLRQIRDRLASATGLALSDLSMGMTDDYEVAIEEGATIVRVGRAIFGERLIG